MEQTDIVTALREMADDLEAERGEYYRILSGLSDEIVTYAGKYSDRLGMEAVKELEAIACRVSTAFGPNPG